MMVLYLCLQDDYHSSKLPRQFTCISNTLIIKISKENKYSQSVEFILFSFLFHPNEQWCFRSSNSNMIGFCQINCLFIAISVLLMLSVQSFLDDESISLLMYITCLRSNLNEIRGISAKKKNTNTQT